MSTVFAGVNDVIDGALGVMSVGTTSPHYGHKGAALLLRSIPSTLDTSKLLMQIQSRIQANLQKPNARWRTMGGSKDNWRWKKILEFTPREQLDEVAVERLIVSQCGDCWANQVPTASGFLDKWSDKRCSIDLVNNAGLNLFEFIELKKNKDTPLFAAFEILKYALVFLISRERCEEFKYSHERNPLIWASAVNLIVLAPSDYYAPYALQWLEQELNSALGRLSTPELALQFAFEMMPWPHDRDCQTALLSRRRVYPA